MELAQIKNDFLGINYYLDNRIGSNKDSAEKFYDMSNVFDLDVDMTMYGEKTDMRWPITPDGLYNLLTRWKRELGDHCPDIYITENGCAYDDGPNSDGEVNDLRRISYLEKHLAAAERAISDGVPLKGYYQWSLLDNFEWAFGYQKRFGIVHVDFETQKRTIKKSGYWYAEQIVTRSNY